MGFKGQVDGENGSPAGIVPDHDIAALRDDKAPHNRQPQAQPAGARGVAPLELLKHLLAENDMGGADLSRLLGGSRQLGPMILRGERSITAEHARKLGARFALDPGAFI